MRYPLLLVAFVALLYVAANGRGEDQRLPSQSAMFAQMRSTDDLPTVRIRPVQWGYRSYGRPYGSYGAYSQPYGGYYGGYRQSYRSYYGGYSQPYYQGYYYQPYTSYGYPNGGYSPYYGS